MISALTGELRRVDEDRVQVQVGPMLYELLVPAADVPELKSRLNEELTFHTIFYLEGDASGGNLEPRLLGFQRQEDKSFFQLFITVKGIGPKKALRALALPVGEIAGAIEAKNTRFLCELPQIGKRMAELIVAELGGKVETFVTTGHAGARPPGALHKRSAAEEDAIAALVALGERRIDAEHLLERARHANSRLSTTNEYINEMLRMRSVRG